MNPAPFDPRLKSPFLIRQTVPHRLGFFGVAVDLKRFTNFGQKTNIAVEFPQVRAPLDLTRFLDRNADTAQSQGTAALRCIDQGWAVPLCMGLGQRGGGWRQSSLIGINAEGGGSGQVPQPGLVGQKLWDPPPPNSCLPLRGLDAEK